jgi:DNA-directed RNA polymerase specialized sigma24 family protein
MSDYPDLELPALLALDPVEVERALSCLPFLEREALLLKARERLSYAEIGTVLGLSESQAEARTASALVKLNRQITRRRPGWRQVCLAAMRRLLAWRET